MTNNLPDHLVYSKNVLEMLTVANDYCLAMAKISFNSKSALLDYLQKICPLLYIKAALLPDIAVQNPDADERFVTGEEWENLFNELRKILKNDDEFWFVDTHETNTPKPKKGSLAECLTDIYQDLKDFIDLYQKNSLDAKENAVNSLKNLFETRMGYALVNAHQALHYLLMKKSNTGNNFNAFEV